MPNSRRLNLSSKAGTKDLQYLYLVIFNWLLAALKANLLHVKTMNQLFYCDKKGKVKALKSSNRPLKNLLELGHWDFLEFGKGLNVLADNCYHFMGPF